MIGYENVDEHKLLRLFCSKESLSAMPLLKDNKVFAYFRIDENITIVISPYCDYDEEDADAKVEL